MRQHRKSVANDIVATRDRATTGRVPRAKWKETPGAPSLAHWGPFLAVRRDRIPAQRRGGHASDGSLALLRRCDTLNAYRAVGNDRELRIYAPPGSNRLIAGRPVRAHFASPVSLTDGSAIPDQERDGWRRSAFLKERGRVKVLVLVVSARDRDASACGRGFVGDAWGVVCCAPGFVDHGSGRLGCQAFLR